MQFLLTKLKVKIYIAFYEGLFTIMENLSSLTYDRI